MPVSSWSENIKGCRVSDIIVLCPATLKLLVYSWPGLTCRDSLLYSVHVGLDGGHIGIGADGFGPAARVVARLAVE
jgi:hypothetical protein